MLKKIKKFLLDILFPKFCLGCKKEGEYLCEDCKATLEISEFQYCLCSKSPKRVIVYPPAPERSDGKRGKCPKCQSKKLNGLYFALPYKSPLIKELIKKFKYKPFAKEISNTLASLILDHFLLIGKNAQKDFADFLIIPVPLDKSREKWRGFNQATEIGKKLSQYLKIPLESEILIKIKKTALQVNLGKKEREENIKGAFTINPIRYSLSNRVKGRKILLVDDVYTTGSTMEECAKVLKKAKAKEVWGVAVARE